MYNFQEPENRETWDNALKQFPEANLLQSWQWGDSNEQLGHTIVRYVVMDNHAIVGAFSGIVKNAKRGRYLEIPGGPLLDWTNQPLVDAVITQLRTIGREHHCVFIRFRTQLPDTLENRQLMQKIGAKESLIHVTADHTAIVDLDRNEDTLLSAMRQQTRYEVRRSVQRDIAVEYTNPLEAIEIFHALQAETAKRQNFYAPSLSYLRSLCVAFGDNARLYRASKDGTVLNLALTLTFGNEIAYFEAASTIDARKEPGAYAIIWRIMQDAKTDGLATLNLWGTAPPGAKHHRYAGVTTFKRGFGGRDVAYLPAHDIALRPVQYLATRGFEWARKKRRHL